MSTRNVLDAIDDLTCTVCKGKLVSDFYNGEKICSLCGVVTGDNHRLSLNETDMSSPTSNITNNDSPTSLMMYDIGLPSVIDSKNIDANGNRIHDPDIEKLRKL